MDLRKAKQWALADKIRDSLKSLGVIVEDGPQGSTWRHGVTELLYGRHAVLEALRAGRRQMHRVYLAPNARRIGSVAEILSAAAGRGCPVSEAPRAYPGRGRAG